MSKALLKPKYLCLDEKSKKDKIENITSGNPDEDTKSMAKECMLFTDKLDKKLKDPAVKFQEIKKLFEVHLDNLKKLIPAQ